MISLYRLRCIYRKATTSNIQSYNTEKIFNKQNKPYFLPAREIFTHASKLFKSYENVLTKTIMVIGEPKSIT